jgi:nitrite reductase (NO-forming)
MNASRYLFVTIAAAAIAAAALASAAPASACEAGGKHHHPAASGTDEAALDFKSAPADERGPQTMRVDLETVEANGKLENGVSYNYRTPAKTNP